MCWCPMKVLQKARKLTFTVETSGDYYVYVTNKKVEKVTATMGEKSRSFDNVDRGYFLELGYLVKGTDVNFAQRMREILPFREKYGGLIRKPLKNFMIK